MTHPYIAQLEERLDGYAAHMATMVPSPEIAAWAQSMAAKFGPKAGVWNVGKMVVMNEQIVDLTPFAYDWATALMIVRYGEAVEHWPSAFSAADVARAQRWLDGSDMPPGVNYFGK